MNSLYSSVNRSPFYLQKISVMYTTMQSQKRITHFSIPCLAKVVVQNLIHSWIKRWIYAK